MVDRVATTAWKQVLMASQTRWGSSMAWSQKDVRSGSMHAAGGYLASRVAFFSRSRSAGVGVRWVKTARNHMALQARPAGHGAGRGRRRRMIECDADGIGGRGGAQQPQQRQQGARPRQCAGAAAAPGERFSPAGRRSISSPFRGAGHHRRSPHAAPDQALPPRRPLLHRIDRVGLRLRSFSLLLLACGSDSACQPELEPAGPHASIRHSLAHATASVTLVYILVLEEDTRTRTFF